MTESRPPRLGAASRAAVIVVVWLLVTLVLAVLANLALDESLARAQGHHMWDDDYQRPFRLFLLGVAAIWLVVLLLQVITGHIGATVAVTVVVMGAVAIANYQKMTFRGEPVYPSDVRFASDPAFLKDMIGARVLLICAAGLAAALAVCFGVYLLSRRFVPRLDRSSDRWTWRLMLAGRLAVAVACALLLSTLSHFNVPGNDARRIYNASGGRVERVEPARQLLAERLRRASTHNTPVPAMTQPSGYGPAEMRQAEREVRRGGGTDQREAGQACARRRERRRGAE